jgi:hypothetical protein
MPAVALAEPGRHLAKIRAVGKEGQGNVEAARAWQELVKLGPRVLIDILTALDDADPRAANWLRSAVDAIAEREVASKRPLPADKLEAFVKDTKHSGLARRLAYEWLVKVDATAPDRLLPGMLNDPGQELRRDAVVRKIAEADRVFEDGDREAAARAYRTVFAAVRDRDQVDYLASQLKKLGIDVDRAAHLGIIQRWHIIGPFDNSNGIGFNAVYPPEKLVDLKGSYPGKEGKAVSWKQHATADPYGVVDFNKAIEKSLGVVGYAFAAVESPREQAVEVRAASANAVRIYLNGKEIFAREEYHHGNRFDGMVGKGILKAGRNEVLIKVCQNEQKEDWAQAWSFQLRICDAIGGAVPFKIVEPGN